MSELVTDEVFTDGQQNINAANMNGIISLARVQPDLIANKPASATLDVADQMLILKTDNTLARGRFDTIVNSTSSALPLADTTKNGMLKQVSGRLTDFVDGTNNCQPVSNIIPVGTVWDFLGAIAPLGWLFLDGALISRTTYAALFAILGTTYGAGDGSTTFGLPDLRGRTTIGAGTGAGLSTRALGAKGGEEAHVLSIAELAQHTHIDSGHNHSQNPHGHSIIGAITYYSLVSLAAGPTAYLFASSMGGTAYNLSTTNNAGSNNASNAVITNTGSNGAHNTMPPYVAVNKIIKT